MIKKYYLIKRFIKRNFRGFKHILVNLKESYTWNYESCYDCGSCYRIWFNIHSSIYIKVIGDDCGLFCPSCFIKRAEKLGIEIKSEDIKFETFQPKLLK